MLFKTTTLLVLCCEMSLLHYALSLDLTGVAVTTVNTTLYPPLENVTSVSTAVYICRGGMQVNVLNKFELLVTVCTNSNLNLSAAIGTLPVDRLDQPVNILYGNASSLHTTRFDPANYVDGDNTTMRICEPEYLYQTSDGRKIFFTDDRSCLREIDRVTGDLTTLIGTCGISTLDWVSSGGIYIHYQARAINGMTYYEAAKTWFISVENNGLFAYIRSKISGNFEGRLLIKRDELSTSVTDFNKQLYINGAIVWQKVNYGLNRYNVSQFTEDGNGTLRYDNKRSSTFKRQLSAVYGVAPDSTAIHRTTDEMRQLGEQNAEFGIIPAYPDIVMIADDDLQRLYFYNSVDGDVDTICSKGAPADGNDRECRFETLRAAVWVDEFKILVVETVGSLMRVVTWQPSTTSKPTTTTKESLVVSYAVKCYKCSGTGCDDKYAKPSGDEVECAGDDGCSKLKTVRKPLGVKAQTIVRSCGGSKYDNICKKNLFSESSIPSINEKSWQCSCKGELCNGAEHVTLTFPLLAAVIAKFVL